MHGLIWLALALVVFAAGFLRPASIEPGRAWGATTSSAYFVIYPFMVHAVLAGGPVNGSLAAVASQLVPIVHIAGIASLIWLSDKGAPRALMSSLATLNRSLFRRKTLTDHSDRG